jgi:hypothetical protein
MAALAGGAFKLKKRNGNAVFFGIGETVIGQGVKRYAKPAKSQQLNRCAKVQFLGCGCAVLQSWRLLQVPAKVRRTMEVLLN